MNSLETPFKSINCPQCGGELPIYFAHAKLAQCKYCSSSIFLEDEAARLAGYSSVLAPKPSLIELNSPFTYKQKHFLPVGMVRYSYGRGSWEEWWIKDDSDEEWWLSVDEGDMVLEKLIENTEDAGLFSNPYIGQRVGEKWMVTEIGKGECEGFAGSLPYHITIGQTHKYLHLSGYEAKLKTLELDASGMRSYEGEWIDSMDIRRGW